MKCYKCEEKMPPIREIKNDYLKYRLFQCDTCKSYGHIYYYPDTENIKKVHWDESKTE